MNARSASYTIKPEHEYGVLGEVLMSGLAFGVNVLLRGNSAITRLQRPPVEGHRLEPARYHLCGTNRPPDAPLIG